MNLKNEMMKEFMKLLPDGCKVFGDYVKNSIKGNDEWVEPMIWRPYGQMYREDPSNKLTDNARGKFAIKWHDSNKPNINYLSTSGEIYEVNNVVVSGFAGTKFDGVQIEISWVKSCHAESENIAWCSSNPKDRLWMDSSGKIFAEDGVNVDDVIYTIKPVVKNGLIVSENGSQRWYMNDKLHNEDGPAVSYPNPNGYEAWYKDGILHRTNGPAVHYENGDQSFYINGIQYTEKVYWERIEALGLKHISKENEEFEKNRRIEMKQGFTEMVKSDAEDAAYRIGAFQGSKLLQKGLIELLKKQGMSKKGINSLTELFGTELGRAFLMGTIGVGVTQIPALAAMPKVQRMAKECRVAGMSVAGNFAIDGLVDELVPGLMSLLNSLPEPVVQARIATSSEPVEVADDEHEEEVVKEPKKKLKAV